MTKKHFIELADYIKMHNQSAKHEQANPFLADHLETLARFCTHQNYDFKKERWLSYIAGECGSNGGTIKPKKAK